MMLLGVLIGIAFGIDKLFNMRHKERYRQFLQHLDYLEKKYDYRKN